MKALYCVGTHWDREWYEPFQEYRMWLVELIDELMDLMNREPDFKSFHLDGQAVVLQDYLEIRPERRERLLAYLKEGRILAGPWYVLPDEWLISGESFIRNIMTGMRTCRELGVEPMPFAYTPDQFGHVAALPMIMTGFGLKAGLVWRGAQDENYPAHFVWIGPDGSRMVTNKLMDKGSYGVFDFLARGPIRRAGYTEESYKEHFERYIEEEKRRSPAPVVLMLDAIDHQRSNPEMVRLFKELVRRYPDIEFRWATLPEFADELLKHVNTLPERRGELRQPARDAHRGGQYLIVHTISARYPLKKRNDQCQALLEKWAEPCALFQKMAAGEPILRYLDSAWQYLLKNHPHDSICGCSIDQVHRDMLYRFDQCEQIADGVIRRALAYTGNAADTDDAVRNVVVVNPLPFRRKGVFEIAIEFSSQWPKRFVDGLTTGEHINKFALVKKDGARVPFQISAIERGVVYERLRSDGRNTPRHNDVYHLAVEMDLPPCGHTGFRIEPVDEAVRNFGTLMTDTLAAGNGIIRFGLDTTGLGTLVLEDTGLRFPGLFLYEDCGDAGDGWTRGQLTNDIMLRSPGTRVTTAIDENGPLRTVFRVEREFDLPSHMERRTWTRAETRTALRVVDRVYVERGLPGVRVRTMIQNTCRDHRFRVLFPTHIPAEKSFAETPFAIVERDIIIPPETAGWQERVNPESAFTTFFGLQGQDGGLAILAPWGLHEYEVTQTPDRSLALTLFRSFFQTVFTSGEPDGELLGAMDFEYFLFPFAGQFDPIKALQLVTEAQAGIKIHQTAQLPDERTFVSLKQNNAVVTALKPTADGLGGVIRLWNPTTVEVRDEVQLSVKVKAAHRCNLNEEQVERLTLNADGTIPVRVPAGGLTSVRFTWE